MKTKEEIAEEFNAEFLALLKKYNASFEICEQSSNSYYGGTWEAEIDLQAEYDKENNCIREYHNFKLPRYLN
jgi:hypothetical protein